MVVTHRSLDAEGGVTASLRTLALELGIEWRWTTTTSPDRDVFTVPLVLFNGAFSLVTRDARDVLTRRKAQGLPSAVYWHEASLGQRRLQGFDVHPDRIGRKRRKAWPHLAALLADDAVCHLAASVAVKQAVVSSIGVDPRRVFVVYNAIAPSPHHRVRTHPVDELRVCAAGGNDPKKNAAAFVRLARDWEHPRIPSTWTWYGDNETVRASADVITPGFQTPLTQALAEHDVYVSLSLEEAFGIAPLEALSVGIPVIAIESHGLAEHLPQRWVAHCEREIPEILTGLLEREWPDAATSRAIAARFTSEALVARIEWALRHFSEAVR
jgi:glycosyltransferase involved in cell wall biosynthesis